MRKALQDFDNTNAQILAIDPHESWAAKALLKDAGATTDDLSFPVLMDPSVTVSSTYGVSFQMRIHTELSNRPATFIIDKAGVIQYVKRAETFSDRPNPKTVLAELKKLAK